MKQELVIFTKENHINDDMLDTIVIEIKKANVTDILLCAPGIGVLGAIEFALLKHDLNVNIKTMVADNLNKDMLIETPFPKFPLPELDSTFKIENYRIEPLPELFIEKSENRRVNKYKNHYNNTRNYNKKFGK